MIYPTLAHFRHFSHFRHSFNYNIFPDTLCFNKQSQLTKCPNRLKLFYNNELCKYYQSDESQKQTQTKPIKPNSNPIAERVKNDAKCAYTKDYEENRGYNAQSECLRRQKGPIPNMPI